MTKGEQLALDALDDERELHRTIAPTYLVMAMSLVSQEKREDMAAAIMVAIEKKWTWEDLRKILRVIVSEDRGMLV